MVDGRASLPISTIFSPEATIALLATLAGNLASLKPIFDENMKKGLSKDKAKSEANLAKTIGAAEGAGVSLSVGISQLASSLTNPSAIQSFVSGSPVTDVLKPKNLLDASAGFGIQVIYERSGSNPGVMKFRLNLEQSMTGLIKGLDVQVFRAVAEQFNNLIALEGPNVIYVNPILRPIFIAVSKAKEKGTKKGLFKGKK
jgi:hypothetical protein